MEKFNKLLAKLKPYNGPSEYVTDKYNPEDMYQEVSDASKQLSPEDIAKLHNAESTMGQNQSNPLSSAAGNFHIIDSTREEALKRLKEQGIDDLLVNPDRKDALLLKNLIQNSENKLENARTGPKEPNIENIYMMHQKGTTGALKALNDPNSAEYKASMKKVLANLNKRQPERKKQEVSAKNLLDLLGED